MSQFIDQIKERKVIPYFITYLGGCWAIIQLLDWYIERNMFSPYWTQLVFYFLVILIPAVIVILFAVNKQKGEPKFGRFQYSFVGINILVALVSLGFIYKQKPMVRIAEKVLVVNEEGKELERIIPAAEFTKRMVIFPFDPKEGIADNNIRIGVPFLAAIDIEQNPTQFVSSAINLKSRYSKYNRDITENVPFSVKKQIAIDTYSDLFITGEYQTENDKIILDLKCYTSKDGRELFQDKIEANDLFELTDKITATYTLNLYTADHINSNFETFQDLPANSLVTNNLEAFTSFINGAILGEHDSKYAESIQELKKSLATDPNCAECAVALSNLYMAVNNGPQSIEMASQSMNNVEVLSERQQLRIKAGYYLRNSEMNKALTLFEMWRQLYPNNLEPYANLIQFYPMMGETQKAIEVGKDAVANGLKGSFLLTIANLLANENKFEEAENYFFKFQEEFPEKASESTSLGNIYNKQGRFDEAIAFYQKIELLRPKDYNIKKLIGIAQGKKGNVDQEYNLYMDALEASIRVQDSVAVYRQLEDYYSRLGRTNDAFEVMNLRYKLQSSYLPPVAEAIEIFQNPALLNRYKNGGRLEALKTRLNNTKAIFNDPAMVQIVDMVYYQLTEDIDQIENNYNEMSSFILAKSGETQKLIFDISIAKVKNEFSKALQLIDQLEEKVGSYPKDLGTIKPLCLMGAGQYKEALDAYQPYLLESPNDPQILQELGNLHLEMNETKQAKQYFDSALEFLKDADADYKIKKDIENKLALMNI